MVITEIILIIFFVAEDGEAHTVSKNKTWSSDHQLLIAKFRLKLEKVGKNTRPFRYDLNQIPYDLYSGGDEYIQGTRCGKQSA